MFTHNSPNNHHHQKKIYYIRRHSNVIRRWVMNRNNMDDDPQVSTGTGLRHVIMKLTCRKKERLLSQAWQKWIGKTQVYHDYTTDVRIILTKQRNEGEMLDELEIEVLYKWVIQHQGDDPTGLPSLLASCKSRNSVIDTLQNLRIEQFEPGEMILFQNTLPRSEDGLFTILCGTCDVLQFPEGSMSLLNLGVYFKNRDWDNAKEIVDSARLINTMGSPTGFGELASLALIKRTASVRASLHQTIYTELLIIPRKCLYSVLASSVHAGSDIQSTSEAIDFLRQSGLGMSVPSRDLFNIASSMKKKTLCRGSVLYFKNQIGQYCYIVVSGELLADTQYNPGENPSEYPYYSTLPANCYILSNGSLLGDEAFMGNLGGRYESTAAVITEFAVVFEMSGDALEFLIEKLNASRYSALAYKQTSPWSVPIQLADSNCVYSMFNSLRKCISESNPYRGVRKTQTDSHSGKVLSLTPVPTLEHKHARKILIRQEEANLMKLIPWAFPSGSKNSEGLFASTSTGIPGASASSTLANSTTIPANSSTSTNAPIVASVSLMEEGSQVHNNNPNYVLLPNTVIQHALKIKKDHKTMEAIRIRSTARVSIIVCVCAQYV